MRMHIGLLLAGLMTGLECNMASAQSFSSSVTLKQGVSTQAIDAHWTYVGHRVLPGVRPTSAVNVDVVSDGQTQKLEMYAPGSPEQAYFRIVFNSHAVELMKVAPKALQLYFTKLPRPIIQEGYFSLVEGESAQLVTGDVLGDDCREVTQTGQCLMATQPLTSLPRLCSNDAQ